MENRIITFIGKSFYICKVTSNDEPTPDKIKDKVVELSNKLQEEFFKIERGKTENVRAEALKMLQSWKYLIPNLDLTEKHLCDFLEELFNQFHYNVSDLQAEKAREMLSTVKNVYHFNPVNKRFLLPDLNLVDEEAAYLQEVFNMKVFRSESLISKFLGHFKGFIEVYNDSVKSNIEELIMRTEEEYMHQISISVSMIKRKIHDFILNEFNSRRLQRLIVSVCSITIGNEDAQRNWCTIFEGIFQEEEVILKQIIRTGFTTSIISLAFMKIDQILLIIIEDLISRPLSNLIPGCDTIIASGSTLSSLILFKNKELKCVEGYIVEGRYVQAKDQLFFYLDPIIGGAYFRSTKEVVYLRETGEIFYFGPSKTKTTEQLTKYSFKDAHISVCERYIALYSVDEMYLINSDLKLIYIESKCPRHCVIHEDTLYLLFISENDCPRIKKVEIQGGVSNKPKTKDVISERFGSELRTSLNLGMNLITGILAKNAYNISGPNIIPSSQEAINSNPLEKTPKSDQLEDDQIHK
ncbi:hypothetical protein SteCoe_7241 [Stentor coeruleus]|uniref:Uncharacterized protein n=1 Tax=Stentor coeruleus TaxID=5963 RepID=A0A1R2CN37_9CILI|nr:hypothetical protein SteCoe_7241 [Stentor coeruleus]